MSNTRLDIAVKILASLTSNPNFAGNIMTHANTYIPLAFDFAERILKHEKEIVEKVEHEN